jgi:hypothetical protein
MVFEREYHEGLQLELDDKRELLRDAEALWLYDGASGVLIGETYGTPPAVAYEDGEQGSEDIAPYTNDPTAIYVFSNTILPPYQRQGFGRLLKAAFLGLLIGRGYQTAIGHAREGGSVALNRSFGAQFVAQHDNWFGSGERYHFYALNLLAGPRRLG